MLGNCRVLQGAQLLAELCSFFFVGSPPIIIGSYNQLRLSTKLEGFKSTGLTLKAFPWKWVGSSSILSGAVTPFCVHPLFAPRLSPETPTGGVCFLVWGWSTLPPPPPKADQPPLHTDHPLVGDCRSGGVCGPTSVIGGDGGDNFYCIGHRAHWAFLPPIAIPTPRPEAPRWVENVLVSHCAYRDLNFV